MHNPNFAFMIGDSSEGAIGRSVKGHVCPSENGWSFQADLVRRDSSETYSLNRVSLTVRRPFDPYEFVFFHTMISKGRFQTNSRDCALEGENAGDLRICKVVEALLTNIPAEARPLSDAFKEDISKLDEQLKRVRQVELLQRAFAARGPTRDRGRSPVIVLDS